MNRIQDEILVSIQCATFNQESYIRQCLDGFVMQQTNFRFEAIVHDDASTDNTAAIIQEYANKYPDIIQPIFETENQYSKHNGSITRIMRQHMRGKYIAFCEGDDYWIDPLKLQKQVDLLEQDPEIGLVNTENHVLYEEEGVLLECYNRKKNRINSKTAIEQVAISELLSSRYFIKTGSVCLRRDLYEEYAKSDEYQYIRAHFPFGDIPLWVYIASKKKLAYIEDPTMVYRRHIGSASNLNSIRKRLYFYLKGTEFRMYCLNTYEVSDIKYKDQAVQNYEQSLCDYLSFVPDYAYIYPVSQQAERKIQKIRQCQLIRFGHRAIYILKMHIHSLVRYIYRKFRYCLSLGAH